MKKRLISFALASCAIAGAWGQQSRAGEEFDLTYVGANEYMWSDIGLGFNDTYDIEIAIVFPKEKMAIYDGCKLTQLKFGWNTQEYYPEATCFVRNSLTGDNLVELVATFEQSNEDAENWSGSWNTVELAEPLLISADQDLVIGYRLETEPNALGRTSIPYSSMSTYYPGTQYIINYSLSEEQGGNQWIELYDDNNDRATSPIFAGAILIDDHGQLEDLVELLQIYAQPILSTDRATTGVVMIANRGINDINTVTVRCSMGDQSISQDVQLSETLISGDMNTFGVPFFAFGTGTHTIEIIQANGNDNPMAAKMEYNAVGVPDMVASQYTMTPLIEYFCSENNYNSAKYYEDIVVPGLELNGDKMVMVNQHMDDQFMLFDLEANNTYDDATTMLIDYVDGDLSRVYVPTIAVNRTAYPNLYAAMMMPTNPASSIIFPMFVNELLYNPALETPTFGKVDLAVQHDADNGMLNVTVAAGIEGGILPEGENPRVTVYVVEDDVYSDSQEKPDDAEFLARFPGDDYYQQNVIRACLTPMYGIEMTTQGTALQYNVPIEKDWNVQKISVVAILSRDPANDRFNRNVINCAEKAPDVSSVVDIDRDDVNSPTIYYNLDGVQIDHPNSGLYIMRKGQNVSKVIIK